MLHYKLFQRNIPNPSGLVESKATLEGRDPGFTSPLGEALGGGSIVLRGATWVGLLVQPSFLSSGWPISLQLSKQPHLSPEDGRQYVPLKRWCLPASSHVITTQKTNIDIFTATRASAYHWNLLSNNSAFNWPEQPCLSVVSLWRTYIISNISAFLSKN
jgi:hypothetical protein